VFERGLVTPLLKRKPIIEEYNRFSPLEQDVKKFKGAVLGYVTPVSFGSQAKHGTFFFLIWVQ
jgi:hypothetical protein